MRGVVAPLIKMIIFLVITTLATYVLATTISNASFGSAHSYKADFSDVTGLDEGDDVRIAGVRVGTVTSIEILRRPDQASVAQVTFTVQSSRSLPKSTEVDLRYRNLIGQRYVDVQRGPGNGNATLAPGSTIPLDHTKPAVDLTVLFEGFKPLVAGLDPNQLNQLSYEVIQALQGEGGALQTLFARLADLTNSLADKDHVIGEVIDNLNSVLGVVNQRDGELSSLIVELKDFIGGLAQDRTTIGNAIGGINDLATSTSGLLTQIRAPLKSDITALGALSKDLNSNSKVLTYVIQQLAPTVAGLIRTASYGSWFNFYLCSVSGYVTLPGGKTLNLSQLGNGSSDSGGRCS